jgi:hypothetical protein
MKLVVEELKSTTLAQNMNLTISAGLYSPTFAPWLYFHNLSTGSFMFRINGPDGFLSDRFFTIADIKAQLGTTDNYGHVFFRIPFTGERFPRGEYILNLTYTDYTYDPDSYLGWCKDWENDFEETLISPWQDRPYCFRIFNKDNREI